MHALPVKPRLIVVRHDHQEAPTEHPAHSSPKKAILGGHALVGSPPKAGAAPLEAHCIEPQAVEDTIAAHAISENDLKRIHSVQNHRVEIDDNEGDER